MRRASSGLDLPASVQNAHHDRNNVTDRSFALAGDRALALSPERVRALRRRARFRRVAGLGLLLVPALAIVGLDLARRGERVLEFAGFHRWTYLGAVLESTLLWAMLLYASSRRSGWVRWLMASLFVIAVTFSLGGQHYFYQQYRAYLNIDVSLFASNFMDSVLNQLLADIGNYAKANLPPLLIAIALVWVARRVVRPRRRPAQVVALIAPVALIAALFIPTQHRHLQAATPDVLYLHAVGGLLRTQLGLTDQSNQIRPRSRESLPVPALVSRVDTPRNVVFVILESVRADATCIDHDPECRRTEATNRLFPRRFGFTQMRSMASTTAVSLAVLWGGLLPNEDRETLHTWPLLFDYARAAGWDTAYWTSQNMMFGNARLWVKNLGVTQFVSATDLDPTADLDMGAPENLIADYAIENVGKLREPFLAVLHLSNGHYPYYIDPDLPQPFQPAATSKAPGDNQSFFNNYQNAVYQQDLHVAAFLGHVAKSELGPRTVIVYTSDHGEAFREHGQMGHTFSIYDEEIHVPGWIHAPEGVLSGAQQDVLRKKRDELVFHIDLAPTVLEIMGLLDAPEIAAYQLRMPGHSLLRPGLSEQALPMTNCAGVWSCAFENWGFMRKNMKLEARAWDTGWRCYDVLADPYEQQDLGPAACGDLVDHARRTFGRLPGRKSD
jgi:glucan phosphoethanolaminetransferase (alkaline phosphatase superfamily)